MAGGRIPRHAMFQQSQPTGPYDMQNRKTLQKPVCNPVSLTSRLYTHESHNNRSRAAPAYQPAAWAWAGRYRSDSQRAPTAMLSGNAYAQTTPVVQRRDFVACWPQMRVHAWLRVHRLMAHPCTCTTRS